MGREWIIGGLLSLFHEQLDAYASSGISQHNIANTNPFHNFYLDFICLTSLDLAIWLRLGGGLSSLIYDRSSHVNPTYLKAQIQPDSRSEWG